MSSDDDDDDGDDADDDEDYDGDDDDDGDDDVDVDDQLVGLQIIKIKTPRPNAAGATVRGIGHRTLSGSVSHLLIS